jgi:hypothetical protein
MRAHSLEKHPLEKTANTHGSSLASRVCTHASCTHLKPFPNLGALANHKRSHGRVKKVCVIKQTRTPRSVRFKANAVNLLAMSMMLLCMKCGTIVPHDEPSPRCSICNEISTSRVESANEVAAELGVHPSMLSRWKQNADDYTNHVRELGSMQKLHRGPLPTYPEEEDALYMAFINLRKNQGFPVDGYWLRAEMGKS